MNIPGEAPSLRVGVGVGIGVAIGIGIESLISVPRRPYYDQIRVANADPVPLKVRSLVGLLPLIAVAVVDQDALDRLPGFKRRFEWFLKYRSDLARHISWIESEQACRRRRWLLAMPSRERLERLLRILVDESEFLSPFGVRSLSKRHRDRPYVFRVGGEDLRVDYMAGESNSYLFGGNSNWRGPVWFPVNYLLIEALERYGQYYGDALSVECPAGSGRRCTLAQVADELSRRLVSLFLPGAHGGRPSHGGFDDLRRDADGRNLTLFHEYFDAETGRGLGASHQTGWTALVTRLLERNP